MPAPLAFEPLINANEASALLHQNPATLLRWARNGQIPCLRFGRTVAFRASALNAWLEQHEYGYSQITNHAALTLERQAA